MTPLRCGGICNRFYCKFPAGFISEEFWKSINIWLRYGVWCLVFITHGVLLGPPIAITQCASPCFAGFFLSFFFSARSPRSLGRLPRNFASWSEMGAILNIRSKICGHPPKNLGPKNMAFFGAILDDFALRWRISPEQNKISKIGKWHCKLRSLPSLLTWSGELRSTNGQK